MKKHLISGLALLLPVAITFWVVNLVVKMLTDPFESLFKTGLDLLGIGESTWLLRSSSLLILLLLFAFTLCVGALARWWMAHYLLRIAEQVVSNIPLVNKVYRAAKEVISTLIQAPTTSFKQVVMVPFPNSSSYGLGLLVKESPLSPTQTQLLSVFIPTTPNPTTGFILMFEKSQVHFTDISVEEALKYIISCGMISPGSAPAIDPADISAQRL